MSALYWARPLIAGISTRFCAITNVGQGSYQTACVGRWITGDPTERQADGDTSERCGRCVELASAGPTQATTDIPWRPYDACGEFDCSDVESI